MKELQERFEEIAKCKQWEDISNIEKNYDTIA